MIVSDPLIVYRIASQLYSLYTRSRVHVRVVYTLRAVEFTNYGFFDLMKCF